MERFEYVSSLGEGAYGVVWLCTDRETGKKVAMKRFKEAHNDPEVMRLALREVRLLKVAQHPNVVKMLEAFRSKSGRVYIAMEFVDRTLTQEMRRWHGKGFPPLLAKVITWQLLQATAFLHARKVMHRDFKPANILLTKDYEVRVCDFGFARQLHPREVAEYTTYVVTRWYRAPEILVSDSYGPKVDVWAIGCLLCEMMGGRPLFPGKSSADQMWLTMRSLGQLPARQAALMADDKLYANMVPPTPAERTTISRRFPQFSDELLSLVYGCLALDPSQRMSAEEALAHPFFADVPETLEAIATSGKPASQFWADVEQAWMAAVQASGNGVSSPSFLKTSAAHAQLSTLYLKRSGSDLRCVRPQSMTGLAAEDADAEPSPAGGLALRTATPTAPMHLVRRGLTSMSINGGMGSAAAASLGSALFSPDSDALATDHHSRALSGTSATVPGLLHSNATIAGPPDSTTSHPTDGPASRRGSQVFQPDPTMLLAAHEGGSGGAPTGPTPPPRGPPQFPITLSSDGRAGSGPSHHERRTAHQLAAYLTSLNGREGQQQLPSSASHVAAHRSRLASTSQSVLIVRPVNGEAASTPLAETTSVGFGPDGAMLSAETPPARSSNPSVRSQTYSGAAIYGPHNPFAVPRRPGAPSSAATTMEPHGGFNSASSAAGSRDVSRHGPSAHGGGAHGVGASVSAAAMLLATVESTAAPLPTRAAMSISGTSTQGGGGASAQHATVASTPARRSSSGGAMAAQGGGGSEEEEQGLFGKIKSKFKSLMAGEKQPAAAPARPPEPPAPGGRLSGVSRVVPPVADTNVRGGDHAP